MYLSHNVSSLLVKPNDAENDQLLTKNMKGNNPSLKSRPVFGVLTNYYNNVQHPATVNEGNCSCKNYDHPTRRRRKLSSEIPPLSPSSSVSSEGSCLAFKLKYQKQEEGSFQPELSSFPSPEADNITFAHLTPIGIFETEPAKPQSVVAFDVVRAAFTKRIALEDFLSECQFADFSFSAMTTSPAARLMEATDYVINIMAYEQCRETKPWFQLDDFIARGSQPSVTEDMITTLADWMVEVQENFAFNHETIHLAWGLLYSFMDRSPRIQRREIQLMACAAIMIACKHEERHMPRMSEFLYITDNAYSKEEFLEAECRLLVTIDFNIHRPNPYVFLRRYARVVDAHSGMVQFMSRFLLEVGMHSHKISLERESKKAAAVLWLARRILSNPSYRDWLNRPETQHMRHTIRQDSRLRAVFVNRKTEAMQSRPLLVRSQSYPERLSLSKCDIGQFKPLNLARTPLNERIANLNDRTHLAAAEHNERKEGEVDQDLVIRVQRLRETDNQLCRIWPSILQHITGYEESELIPLALEYHRIAMRLLAEVQRGGELELASTGASIPVDLSGSTSIATIHPDCDPDQNISCGSDTRGLQKQPSVSAADKERTITPDAQHLRRQVVTKYWSPSFLSVADKYPQLSFENLIPDFPEIRCDDDCTCFVCENLINPGQSEVSS